MEKGKRSRGKKVKRGKRKEGLFFEANVEDSSLIGEGVFYEYFTFVVFFYNSF